MELVVLARELNIKRLCEAVAEIVRCAALESLAVMHKSLDGVCILSSRKTLFGGFNALYDRHCKIFLAELGVNIKHTDCFLLSLLSRCVDRVTLLPKELSCAQERTGRFLPADNADPLVIELGKIPVGVNDVCIMLAEKRFRGWPYAKPFLELFVAAVGYPGNLGSKALNMIFFLFKQAFRNEHRHTHILVTRCLEHTVHYALNVFPNRIAVGSDNHAALNACVFAKLGLFNNIRVPFCKILVH